MGSRCGPFYFWKRAGFKRGTVEFIRHHGFVTSCRAGKFFFECALWVSNRMGETQNTTLLKISRKLWAFFFRLGALTSHKWAYWWAVEVASWILFPFECVKSVRAMRKWRKERESCE